MSGPVPDRTRAPSPGPIRDYAFPAVHRTMHANGMTSFVCRAGDLFERSAAVGGDIHRVSVLAKALGEHVGRGRLVLDDQDSHQLVSSLRRSTGDLARSSP